MIEPMQRLAVARLFVYGTLRKDAGYRAHTMLASLAELEGRATCAGSMVNVGHYPGVVPAADEMSRVVGEVYRLRDPASALTTLDAFEHCDPDDATLSDKPSDSSTSSTTSPPVD